MELLTTPGGIGTGMGPSVRLLLYLCFPFLPIPMLPLDLCDSVLRSVSSIPSIPEVGEIGEGEGDAGGT